MNTLVQAPTQKVQNGSCLSESELMTLGITPTNLQCFTYYHYVLYEKGNLRFILKPLPHNLFKVIRSYNFIPA
jgi:hypothetical protein